jgi:glycerol-3-phosphate O-acyltransferase
MFQTVAVPLWLLVLIVAFATVAFASHFLFPSVRWFFRRRMEKAVARLNSRLALPIQPFKLMRRHDMIIRLVHDPKVAEAVAAEAKETGEPQSVVHERARRYAREIVPAFSAALYFGFATRAARWLARMVYRVRIGHFDTAAISAIDRNATVVFVMNHRSNMDYVLVTHLAAQSSALSYAVGEWARVWPLSALIRAMGAYFIRRKSNNALYRRVLARYVQMAAEEGVTQAIFPEGGLSLTGRVGQARLGILAYIVQGFKAGGRDVVFIPVALNYDRVLEDRVLLGAAAAGTRKFRASVPKMLGFVGRNLWKKVRGSFRRFGYAAVSFGTPLSLSEFLADGASEPTERLAEALMARIVRNVPVLPVPLVCAALGPDRELSHDALRRRVLALQERLREDGAHFNLPGKSAEGGLSVGLEALCLRRVLERDGDRVVRRSGNDDMIAYYAASVEQLADALAASRPRKPRKKRSVAT